jgi:O-antigen ligase
MRAVLAVLRWIATIVAWFGAVVLFVLSPAIGSISSIVAVVLALVLSPTAALSGAWGAVRAQPAMLIFLASFVSLTVCYIGSARQPTDVLFAADFLGLPLAAIVYLLALRRRGEQTALIVCGLMGVGALVGALTGTYDVFIAHKERAIGWAQGGNLMARTVVLLGFLSVAGVFATRARWRWLYLLGPAFSLYALYLTGTRGVFVAVPLLGLIFLWALLRDMKAPRWWYGVGLAVLVVVVIVAGLVSPRFLSLARIFEQMAIDPSGLSDSATSERFYMWTAGWATFLKSPIIGFGWANFTEASKPYGIYMFHNDFFDMAVAAGIVGIGCWIAILAAPVIGATRMIRDGFEMMRLYCALILSAGTFVFGLTDMTLGYDLPTTLYGFATAVVLGAFREAEPAET